MLVTPENNEAHPLKITSKQHKTTTNIDDINVLTFANGSILSNWFMNYTSNQDLLSHLFGLNHSVISRSRFIGPNMHQPKLLHPLVILSTFVALSVNSAKDLARCTEMLRCTQHDNTFPDRCARVDAYYRRFIGPP